MDEGCAHEHVAQFEFYIAVRQPNHPLRPSDSWFMTQPLKSIGLLNKMMDFFWTNVLISDHWTDNKHDEDIFGVIPATWVLMDQIYDPKS